MTETALGKLSKYWAEQAKIWKKQKKDWHEVVLFCRKIRKDLTKHG